MTSRRRNPQGRRNIGSDPPPSNSLLRWSSIATIWLGIASLLLGIGSIIQSYKISQGAQTVNGMNDLIRGIVRQGFKQDILIGKVIEQNHKQDSSIEIQNISIHKQDIIVEQLRHIAIKNQYLISEIFNLSKISSQQLADIQKQTALIAASDVPTFSYEDIKITDRIGLIGYLSDSAANLIVYYPKVDSQKAPIPFDLRNRLARKITIRMNVKKPVNSTATNILFKAKILSFDSKESDESSFYITNTANLLSPVEVPPITMSYDNRPMVGTYFHLIITSSFYNALLKMEIERSETYIIAVKSNYLRNEYIFIPKTGVTTVGSTPDTASDYGTFDHFRYKFNPSKIP